MTVPGIVQSSLDGEDVAARVPIGGEDELFITPESTIIYRAEGLLSDESIDEFPHNADRLTLSEGRRKTRFSLEYAIDGTREFTIPASKTESVLHPVLAGILNGNGITDPGESVVQTYRFSELTVIVTSDRLVKHIGEAVWDNDFEQYHFDDVTNLSFEDGSVATQIVIEVDGRQQRIKAPNDEAADASERLKRALFAYHDVTSLEELNKAIAVDDDDGGRDDPAEAFGTGVDPLDANPPETETETEAESESEPNSGSQTAVTDSFDFESATTAETDTDPETSTAGETRDPLEASIADSDAESGAGESQMQAQARGSKTRSTKATQERAETTTADPVTNTDPELLERLDELEATVVEQNELLAAHQETIETLIEELRHGR